MSESIPRVVSDETWFETEILNSKGTYVSIPIQTETLEQTIRHTAQFLTSKFILVSLSYEPGVEPKIGKTQ